MAIEKGKRHVRAPADGSATVASLAHEINNPVDSLLNFFRLIEAEATFTEKGHLCLALAQEELHRISQITHRAMDQFPTAATPRDTNVPDLLRVVLHFYQSRFDQKGIGIETRFCPDGDLAVDPVALRQMLSNLVLNAADALPEGGTLHARICNAHEWNGRGRRGLRVTFADNGCGIAAEDLARITEPFFTTKAAAGTGLGLALVRDTVAKHHGVMRVRSSTKPGRSGSVFAIFLPSA